MPGCGAPGEYRAPKSRRNLKQDRWFCLQHVRSYNAAWDYYKGMSQAEIEVELRRDTAWQRPTWPLGRLGSAIWETEWSRDPLDILAAGRLRPGADRHSDAAPPELRELLAALGLSWPLTLPALKARYKELAKRHHPDANGGDRAAEERLKTINLAYATLRSRIVATPRMAAAS